MVWIKFTRPYTVKNAAGRTYQEGELVEVSPESARHFTSRFAAVEVQPATPQTTATKTEELPVPPLPPRYKRDIGKPRKATE